MQMQNLNNVMMFPLDNVLKNELKGVKGDLKKPFDKAFRDYETKISKMEKEKRTLMGKDTAGSGSSSGGFNTLTNSKSNIEITPSEVAEELDKEKKIFQLQMCDYLLKANEIKTKKGVELLQHLVDYYHAQTSYFQDGLKTIEHFNGYINELSQKISNIKTKQDDERKKLNELRNLLKSSAPFLDNNQLNSVNGTSSSGLMNSINSHFNHHNNDNTTGRGGKTADKNKNAENANNVYNLHQMQGNKTFGYSKTGYLLKKSEGKMRVKVWQKRKCEVVKDGFLFIYHSDESKAPTKVNLLTCQVKKPLVSDDKKSFDLISCNRTYHFQTEDENETEAWISVLINCKEGALKKEFESAPSDQLNYSLSSAHHNSTSTDGRNGGRNMNQSLIELRQSILKQVLKLSGNDKCVDCNSNKDPTWLSTNFGVLVCIECSGIHRDLGVHISRIQSLTLDNIGTSQLLLARVMSNHSFNDIMEATLLPSLKPTAASSMEERYEFIRAKYIDRKYVLRSCNGVVNDLKVDLEHAIQSRHLLSLLQVFCEGADLSWPLPSYGQNNDTALHLAISQEDGSTLHIVDFLTQNQSTDGLDKSAKDGSTPLHYCVVHDQPECMKLLLRSGANPRKANNKGKTPIDLAKDSAKEHLLELVSFIVSLYRLSPAMSYVLMIQIVSAF